MVGPNLIISIHSINSSFQFYFGMEIIEHRPPMFLVTIDTKYFLPVLGCNGVNDC